MGYESQYEERSSGTTNDSRFAVFCAFEEGQDLPRPRTEFEVDGQTEAVDESTAPTLNEDPRLVELRNRLVAYEPLFFDDYGRSLDAGSKRGLERFLAAHGEIAVPSISAESTGLLVASWAKGMEAIVIRFLNRTNVNFALVLADGNHVSRPWGNGTCFDLFTRVPRALAIAT